MSEMQRHKGIIKELYADIENPQEKLIQLHLDTGIFFDDLIYFYDGEPDWDWVEHRDYTFVGETERLFDISDAPSSDDSYDDVNDAERINETYYRVHAYFYNGGASFNEMLEKSIPKADAEYKNSKSDGFDLTINFPSKEHAEAFAGWLSNSGEQDHYRQMDYEEKDQEYLYRLNYDYTQSSNGLIKAIQIEE